MLLNHRFRVLVLMATAAGGIISIGSGPQAHSNCNSRFNYNNDIFPIVRDHCASCHVPGGAAPMSLVNFKDAQQWASAVRDELTTERMPPWHIDASSPAVKGAHPIGAREINMVVDWASCNTPRVPAGEGDAGKPLPTITFNAQWKLGPPDLKLEVPTAHTLPAGTDEDTIDLDVPTGLTDAKWVKAVDVMAGTASLLRDAVVSVASRGGTGGESQVLALWQPGGDAVAAPSGAAFHLAAGASLHVQLHYKKQYLDAGNAMSDKSTVGLYFTDPPASGRELTSLAIEGPAAGQDSETFSAALPGAARIVALRPMLDRAYDSLEVTAVTSTGRRVTLVQLRSAWPQWFRRYWLEEPIELAGGATIEVRATPHVPDPDDPKEPKRFPLQIGLDYVPR